MTDVLDRLRDLDITGALDYRAHDIIADAITEIERLRADVAHAEQTLAALPDNYCSEPPQYDRWETRLAVLSTSVDGKPTYGHGGQHLDGFEPFSVTTDAYSKTTVWFRRRLPT